jgi:hypothetical protein
MTDRAVQYPQTQQLRLHFYSPALMGSQRAPSTVLLVKEANPKKLRHSIIYGKIDNSG